MDTGVSCQLAGTWTAHGMIFAAEDSQDQGILPLT